MGLFNKILHAGEGRRLKAVQAIVPEVNALEPEIERLSDEQLAGKTAEFKQRVDRARSEAKNPEHEKEVVHDVLDDALPEAFAVVREASRRTIGQRHYDVQIMGGSALHLGWVAEMKTGEGKTLVSTLPAYLNALAGRGVHLVTVNDYLVKRDAEWMGRIHKFLGLTVGVVVPDDSTPDEKRHQYDCDILYGTNNEVGFDYLRDNMVVSIDEQVQRGHRNQSWSPHFFSIVDEVDSILIDEARTPLIISGRAADAAELYYQFARVVRGLQAERDYEVDEAKRTVVPTEEGIARVEQALGVENLYENVHQNYVHQLQQALRGKELFKRDVDYIVQAGEVKIVDEFTGRILEGRRWSEGLHQAVEAKEGVKIKEENQTLATVTLQNYFRLYEKLGGMTGTASTEAGEFAHTYDLQVVSIPTNRSMVRIDNADYIYKTEEAKFHASVGDIAERYEKGQPVLVGTISVEKSERLSRELQQKGIPHEVLNAKQHEREAEIVTQAGKLNAVTVATNMAGRGVDILLGGNPEGLARRECMRDGLATGTPEFDTRYQELLPKFEDECRAEGEKVRALGGLYVLGTERHESRRIDNQLRGRAGRQGDAGESRFYLSLEDELMRLFATGLMSRVMNASFPDDMPLESKMVSRAVERAQGTVEDRNFEIRKNVLKYDEVMNEQRKVIYRRRQQILDGEDLGDEAVLAIESALSRLVEQYCTGEFMEDWDVPGLLDAARLVLPDAHHQGADRRDHRARGARGDVPRGREDAVRGEGRAGRRGDAARHRTPGHALGDRPALARAPLRDGLPPGGHQPAGHGPAGPALRMAARGLRHVRGDDGPDRGRLRPLRVPSPGRRRRGAPQRDPQRLVQRADRSGAGFERDRGRDDRRGGREPDGVRRPGRGDAGDDRTGPAAARPRRRKPLGATSRASAAAARSTSSATGDRRSCAISRRSWVTSRVVSPRRTST